MASNPKRRIEKIERFLYEQHQSPEPLLEQGLPLHRIRSAWKDATVEDRMRIISWIQDQLQSDPDLPERLP